MAQIPKELLRVLEETGECNIAFVCEKLKINQLPVFKNYCAKKGLSKEPYKSFLLEQFSTGNKAVLGGVYNSIEGLLFVGGCAPGVGIAFNIIDACFCIALNNWFSAIIAIVSCLPIPGFKVAGKGVEKVLMKALHSIPVSDLTKFTKMLGVRLKTIGYNNDWAYIKIRKQLEILIEGLHNPFAEQVLRVLSDIIKKFPTQERVMAHTGKSSVISKGSMTMILDKKISQGVSDPNTYSIIEKGIF